MSQIVLLCVVMSLGLTTAGVAQATGRNGTMWMPVGCVSFLLVVAYLIFRRNRCWKSNWESSVYFGSSAFVLLSASAITVHQLLYSPLG